jgi:hypothetical protein
MFVFCSETKVFKTIGVNIVVQGFKGIDDVGFRPFSRCFITWHRTHFRGHVAVIRHHAPRFYFLFRNDTYFINGFRFSRDLSYKTRERWMAQVSFPPHNFAWQFGKIKIYGGVAVTSGMMCVRIFVNVPLYMWMYTHTHTHLYIYIYI